MTLFAKRAAILRTACQFQPSGNPILTPSLWIEAGTGAPPGWSTLETIVWMMRP
jgi:hypothetical protein